MVHAEGHGEGFLQVQEGSAHPRARLPMDRQAMAPMGIDPRTAGQDAHQGRWGAPAGGSGTRSWAEHRRLPRRLRDVRPSHALALVILSV